MTNYTITAEQMKQLLEAVESNAEAVEIEYLDRRKFWGENLPYRWEYLREQTEQAKVTLTMLQSLTPMEGAHITDTPNDDEVICPNCVHQFRAIPVNVQRLMLDAGFEPPFTATVLTTYA